MPPWLPNYSIVHVDSSRLASLKNAIVEFPIPHFACLGLRATPARTFVREERAGTYQARPEKRVSGMRQLLCCHLSFESPRQPVPGLPTRRIAPRPAELSWREKAYTGLPDGRYLDSRRAQVDDRRNLEITKVEPRNSSRMRTVLSGA